MEGGGGLPREPGPEVIVIIRSVVGSRIPKISDLCLAQMG